MSGEDASSQSSGASAARDPSGGASPTQGTGAASKLAASSPAAQVEAIVSDQHATLVQQYADEKGNVAEIASSDRSFMEARGKAPVGPRRGDIVPLGEKDIEDAFVFISSEGKPELWARPSYSDYAGLFDIFTKKYYEKWLPMVKLLDLKPT